MNLPSRIAALRSRHANLDARISDEDHRPHPDQGVLASLKVQKLRIKEEMERLQHR